MSDEQSMSESDTITVPDELLEQMGGVVDDEDKRQAGEVDSGDREPGREPGDKQDDNVDQSEPDAASAESEAADADVETDLEPEPWQPRHNPEYYKKKGEKTRKHIRELSVQRYEAQNEARRLAEELESKDREIARLRNGEDPDEAPVDAKAELREELEDMISFAKEDGKTETARILKERMDRLDAGEDEGQGEAGKPPKIDTNAQKWLEQNEWYNEKDDLGRLKYPHLRTEATHRERALLQRMDRGPALYKKLSEEMEETLEAYDLGTHRNNDDVEDEDTPRPGSSGLQPYRGGGAESSVTRQAGDRMTAKEMDRMRSIFKRTGMNPNDPDHRRAYINNLRR